MRVRRVRSTLSVMDFGYSPTVEQWRERVQSFLDEVILPAEPTFHQQVHAQAATNPWGRPPIMEELKGQARERGLWNLFLPGTEFGAGLTNLEYAPLAELTGRSPMLAPEAMNFAAPDSGNMEVFAHFARPDLQERWLRPLLDGTIRSAYSMTEPDVASSDANNIATIIELDGRADELVVTGRKWWSSGAMAPECKVAVVMGLSAPEGDNTGVTRWSSSRWTHRAFTWSDPPMSSATAMVRTAATPRSCMTRCGYRAITSWASGTAGSRSARHDWAQAGSTTACG